MADSEQTHEASSAPLEGEWDDELIPNHEYDGIQEYDNPIPGWLSLLFWGTIVWGLFYVVAINLGYIDRYEESFEKSREAVLMKRAKAEEKSKEVGPEMLAAAVEEKARVEAGQAIYKTNCAACHDDNGGGDVGPNLTDDHWLHGGKLVDIYGTVADGVTDKGMPAWSNQLSSEEIVSTVAYIRSIRGTEPADAKKPEGEKYVPNE